MISLFFKSLMRQKKGTRRLIQHGVGPFIKTWRLHPIKFKE